MHKMLTIALLLALPSAAWAADAVDRSALSYDENAIINMACAKSSAQGPGAFNSCVAQQIVALHDHPTPDETVLSSSRKRAIVEVCGYLRLHGIGAYNDCVRQALTRSSTSKNEKGSQDHSS